ncbi:hypothetical protein, partial [Klebsiella aerogenes]|uniref:hypothetical protein n=1 Tax=Klebsiella aerogenes TaxID=548 RepID=UPI001953C08A
GNQSSIALAMGSVVYRAKSELFPGKNVSYFYAPESEMAGAISGILMLYLADQTRPVIGFLE